ncbi:hypothetical protein OAD50_04475 [Vicingaceae bacterium]|nr:hypothetical protein [Vicingaceae bacterium]
MRIELLLAIVFSTSLSAQHQEHLDIGNVRALVKFEWAFVS